MVKKCYVRWPDTGRYSGPYEVDEYSRDEYVNILLGGEYGDWIITVPPEWTIGVDDGWTVWEGGECPVGRDTVIEVVYRSGTVPAHGPASAQRWHHIGAAWDIIAYRVVDDALLKAVEAKERYREALEAIVIIEIGGSSAHRIAVDALRQEAHDNAE
jgi:hypothetical protein